MKKIKKYSAENHNQDVAERLKSYQTQANSILRNMNAPLKSNGKSPLSTIVPLVAVALSPIGINAQCGVSVFNPSNTLNSDIGNPNMTIDVDGDGTIDFELDPQTDSLFLFPLNGAEVIASVASGAYRYVTRLNTGDPITSADPDWRSAGDLIAGAATMDYQNYGNWNGAGTVVGYVGIRINGDRMGFMEVSWNDDGAVDEVTVTVALTGAMHPDDPAVASIDAGDCVALPVELIEFKGEVRNGVTSLQWSTASEINNAGFEVQRSTDGKDFRKLGWVEGEINSSRKLSYEFTDDTVMPNREYYYRLKQVDVDGGSQFSNVVTLTNRDESQFMLHDIAPNPVTNSQLFLQLSAGSENQLMLEVYNTVGQRILEQNINAKEGMNQHILDIESLANGTYFVKVSGGDNSSYKKVIVAK